MKTIYLAAPYKSDDHIVENVRLMRVHEKTVELMKDPDLFVFSPLIFFESMQQFELNYWVHEQWMKECLHWLFKCDELWVYCLPGWDESKGVAIEINYAQVNGIRIEHIIYQA